MSKASTFQLLRWHQNSHDRSKSHSWVPRCVFRPLSLNKSLTKSGQRTASAKNLPMLCHLLSRAGSIDTGNHLLLTHLCSKQREHVVGNGAFTVWYTTDKICSDSQQSVGTTKFLRSNWIIMEGKHCASLGWLILQNNSSILDDRSNHKRPHKIPATRGRSNATQALLPFTRAKKPKADPMKFPLVAILSGCLRLKCIGHRQCISIK